MVKVQGCQALVVTTYGTCTSCFRYKLSFSPYAVSRHTLGPAL